MMEVLTATIVGGFIVCVVYWLLGVLDAWKR